MIESLSFLQWIAGVGGIGAVFAVLMFFVYRQAVSQMRIDRKFMEDRLSSLLDNYDKTTKENSKILFELYTYLKAKNGNRG